MQQCRERRPEAAKGVWHGMIRQKALRYFFKSQPLPKETYIQIPQTAGNGQLLR